MLYFVTPQEGAFPGVSRLFDETIAVVGGEHIYLNDLHKVTKDDVVIFGAWSENEYPMAIRRCKAKQKIIGWASPPLQTELAGVEVGYMSQILKLLDKDVIQGLWVIDKNNYETLKRDGVFYTHVPFSSERLESYQKSDKEGVYFFTVFSNKQQNVLTQLGAAYLAQRETDFTLFVNGLTAQQKEFVDTMGLRYMDLHFLPSGDYFEWLSSAGLILQVSVSSSFSYIAAEALSLGVPVLMSPVVAKNMGVDEEKLIVKDISSAEEISSLISRVLALGVKEYKKLCGECMKNIEETARKNNEEVRQTFLNLKN